MMQTVVARGCSCGEGAELLMGMRVAEGWLVGGVLGDRRSGRLWRLVPSPTRSARAWYRQVRRCCRKRRFAGIVGRYIRHGSIQHRTQLTTSNSPGFHVLSNHGCSGPPRRRRTFQPLPGTVCTQLVSCPFGAVGPNQTSTDVSGFRTRPPSHRRCRETAAHIFCSHQLPPLSVLTVLPVSKRGDNPWRLREVRLSTDRASESRARSRTQHAESIHLL